MPSYYKAMIRVGANFSVYTDIAIRHYYEATNLLNDIVKDDIERLGFMAREVSNHIIQVNVLSAMSIESYLNSYISGCIGDNEYYKKYDGLKVSIKLDLIKRFIFHDETNDSDAAFTHIIELQKIRNDLVHNKPITKCIGYTQEEIEAMDVLDDEDIVAEYKAECEFYLQEMKSDIQQGLKSLKAISTLAKYIDSRDDDAHAIRFLFCPTLFSDDDSEKAKAIRAVYPVLGVKIQSL